MIINNACVSARNGDLMLQYRVVSLSPSKVVFYRKVCRQLIIWLARAYKIFIFPIDHVDKQMSLSYPSLLITPLFFCLY